MARVIVLDSGPLGLASKSPRKPDAKLCRDWLRNLDQLGMPTESDPSLGADCIVAASASVVSGLGDVTTIATDNVAHLIRFPGIDAREWQPIAR